MEWMEVHIKWAKQFTNLWLTCSDHPIWAHTMGIYFISKMAKHFISSLVLRHTCYGFCPLHSSIHTHDLFTSHRLYSYPPLMLLNTLGWVCKKNTLQILEIKPSGLGSRIRDVEAFWYKTVMKIIYYVPMCLIVLIVSD